MTPEPTVFVDEDGKMDVANAAKYLGMRQNTLSKYRRRGYGPLYMKIGTRIYYTQENLDRWYDSRTRARPKRPASEPEKPTISSTYRPRMTPRNKEILELHKAGFPLREIGDLYGITAERVRQITYMARGQ